MHPLDIFSDSPKYFIFQKETNKTNFGGVLTLFLGLIMILLSVLYFLDYYEMNNYSIEYSHILGSTLNKDISNLNKNPDFNPNFTFYIKLMDDHDQLLSENFILIDLNTGEKLKNKDKDNFTIFRSSISNFSIGIFYKCINEFDCSLREEDKSKLRYYIYVNYITSKIDLQNSPTPITKDLVVNYITTDFYYKYFYYKSFSWEVIKYKDQNTLFDRFLNISKEYTSGYFSDYKETFTEEKIIDYQKPLLALSFFNRHQKYIEYTRKRNTILDVVVKITSLFQTLHFAFLFFFKTILKILIIIK